MVGEPVCGWMVGGWPKLRDYPQFSGCSPEILFLGICDVCNFSGLVQKFNIQSKLGFV